MEFQYVLLRLSFNDALIKLSLTIITLGGFPTGEAILPMLTDIMVKTADYPFSIIFRHHTITQQNHPAKLLDVEITHKFRILVKSRIFGNYTLIDFANVGI